MMSVGIETDHRDDECHCEDAAGENQNAFEQPFARRPVLGKKSLDAAHAGNVPLGGKEVQHGPSER